ncbi:zinc finger protein ZAT9-like [Lotus japonicus]|uniref:zinc finger protein ZAT9-like n=1 Tax=Lotus japonicus TaxID=34305 RepID=UPI00258F2891|nr:zinc finger protein ZAT9-like [Lotus japonicus]
MEKHKCKLCSRSFANGRALGGHMKAHLAALPLPPKPEQKQSFTSLSFSSSASESQQEEDDDEVLALRESEEKAMIYGLRENPKKSCRVADPKFSFAPDTGFLVQDRESETESKNPTRQRSKRNRRNQNQNSEEPRKVKMSFTVPASPEPPLSSVSDTSPEEDVAMCLMMLSRDNWTRNNNNNHSVGCSSSKEKIKFKRVRGKHGCENCGKAFRSSRALGSHRSVCCVDAKGEGNGSDEKIFECPFCYKVFGSGQALGGHKRSHLIASSSSNANNVGCGRLKQSLIDLNLPAPPEEDDLSVVSDA